MSFLSPQSSLTDDERARGLRLVLWDGVASQAMLTFTGGAFLVAFALQLGATNTQIGLLSAIPTLANVFQLLSVWLTQRFARRQIVVFTSTLGRAMFFVIALIPWLPPAATPMVVLLLSTVVLQACGATSAGGWTAWMRDLIPSERLGSFFSHRMRWSQSVGIVLSIACALALDYWKQRGDVLSGYALLFLLGGVSGLVGVGLLARTPEPRMQPIVSRFRALLARPFQNSNFRSLIIYNALWNFAVNLAAPFFTVYLLQRLGFSITYVILLTALSQVTTVAALWFWGRYADRYSYKTILSICAPLYLLCILGWTFTTLPDPHAFTLPLLVGLHILMGIATAGTSLAASSIGLKLAPAHEAVAYLAVISFTNALAAGIAPIMGGALADLFLNQQLALVLEWNSGTTQRAFRALDIQQWDFFFLFSFLLGLVALYRLAYVREQGEISEKALLKEIVLDIQRDMRHLSTVTGLRSAIKLPVWFVDKLRSR